VGERGDREIMSTVPRQRPGSSEQVVCTPIDFLDSVKDRLAIERFAIDLAADPSNAVAEKFYTEADDALLQDWRSGGWGWCNPPYADIAPWVHKAWIEAGKGAQVAMLLPASCGTNWWRDNVHNKAYVLFVNPRITFVGHTTPYPKDLAILLYTPQLSYGYDYLRWK
jgi:phage N-6-adenine-methyltransferase